jgi:penicillin-binding protein 1A
MCEWMSSTVVALPTGASTLVVNRHGGDDGSARARRTGGILSSRLVSEADLRAGGRAVSTVMGVQLRRILKFAIVSTVLMAVAGSAAIVSLPWTVHFLVRGVPTLSSATSTQASVILDRTGREIAALRPTELVEPLPAGDLPSTLVAVILASEDRRFYQHHGVDPNGLLRAVVTNLKAGSVVEGGSTITQQLVKNEVVGTSRTYERKIREALLALRVEQDLEKDEILRRYLDVVYVGGGIRGTQTAALQWFGVHASELSLGQAALIAGVLPSPNRYSPYNNPELAEKRRQLILDRVAAAGTASPEAIRAARGEAPVTQLLTPKREAIVTTEYPWVLDTVAAELRRLAPEVDLSQGGYVVHTGIDLDLQIDSEKSLTRSLSGDLMPDGAMIVLDANNGEIRAIVGGKDHRVSQVNAALGKLGGGSGRQGGSSLKPITLAAALDAGWGLENRIAAPASIALPGRDPAWNYDRRSWGTISLLTATTWSINTAYLNLAQSVGPAQISSTARKLGLDLTSKGPEIAIGADEVSPMTLASAYGAFADDGRWHTPHIVRMVEQDGVEVWAPQLETRVAIQPSTATAVGEALRSVVTKGTGTRAGISGVEVFGKTGTTDNNADAWFAGWSGDLVAAVWVGNLRGLVPMKNVPGWGSITGGSLPAAIWRDALSRTARASIPRAETNRDLPATTTPIDGIDGTDGLVPTPEPTPDISVSPLPQTEPSVPAVADGTDDGTGVAEPTPIESPSTP